MVALTLFSAVSAIAGGVELIAAREGNTFLPPIAVLGHTPFRDFFLPGILLGGVVGGTSLVCAVLTWRRSPVAVDATLLSGGALTVWIAAEAAMLREWNLLHAVYAGVGIALLGLGIGAAWRSGVARHRWVVSVTLAEGAGFLAPAGAGVLSATSGLGDEAQAALVVAAGLIEGFVLGAGQAWALPIAVRRMRFALLTALGAGAVWASVMTVTRLGGSAAVPAMLVAVAGIAASGVGLVGIGGAQWIELRHHTRGASRWIAWTALAWIVALPWSFAAAPFVDEATPIGANLALWACGGLLMAYVMALVTWQGVRRLG
ncbi:MAG: hypothetical protein Q8P41_14090 [Pseudomonadota bacterium]|nr:hypothetical protein [Pseudomonadota bacterium]